MTIPTGTLSINDIRTEYGLSGTLALSSLYAGGSIIAAGAGGYNGAIPSSGTISLNNFKGHSAPPSVLDTQTVTVGFQSFSNGIIERTGYLSGYSAIGSVSDGTSNVYSGAAVLELAHLSPPYRRVYFRLAGSRANSGWTTMKINGISLARTSASYSANSSRTTWIWASISSSPFGSSGTKSVTWE